MALRPLTPELFALGMTFDQYVDYVGSDENLARELDVGPRRDYSAYLRAAFEARRADGGIEVACRHAGRSREDAGCFGRMVI